MFYLSRYLNDDTNLHLKIPRGKIAARSEFLTLRSRNPKSHRVISVHLYARSRNLARIRDEEKAAASLRQRAESGVSTPSSSASVSSREKG